MRAPSLDSDPAAHAFEVADPDETCRERLRQLAEGFNKVIADGGDERVWGPLAEEVAELYSLESSRELADGLGKLLVHCLADARPLPAAPRTVSLDDAALGIGQARVVRDLDRGRGPPVRDSGNPDGLEAIQRLADFVAAEAPDLRLAAQHAVYVVGDFPPEFGGGIYHRVCNQWPDHALSTFQTWALALRERLQARQRGRKGGASRGAMGTSAASRVWEAFLTIHPECPPFREALRLLSRQVWWGGVEVRDVTEIVYRDRRYVGAVELDGDSLKASAFARAYGRAKKKRSDRTS